LIESKVLKNETQASQYILIFVNSRLDLAGLKSSTRVPGAEEIVEQQNTGGQDKFQIENLILNGGLVEPFLDAMSYKFYCATLNNDLVEPSPPFSTVQRHYFVLLL
jgi:hypothetical protein